MRHPWYAEPHNALKATSRKTSRESHISYNEQNPSFLQTPLVRHLLRNWPPSITRLRFASVDVRTLDALDRPDSEFAYWKSIAEL